MFELLNRLPQVARSPAPGPATLKFGNSDLGYYGETTEAELINGVDLASLVGLAAGTVIANSGIWLKYSYKGKTLFVAKQPLRNFIAPNHLETANVISGSKTVGIQGHTYRIRLLTGGETTPGTGSEWNDLIYRVHVNDPTGSHWAAFTNSDLSVGVNNGRTSWCQEIAAGTGTNRVYRGYASLTEWASGGTGTSSATTGWRPVLEFIG